MSGMIGRLRDNKFRVFFSAVLVAGILSLVVCALVFFHRSSLPPKSVDGYVSRSYASWDTRWLGDEREDDYAIRGVLGGGAWYDVNIPRERILVWPGVPLDGDSSGVEPSGDVVLYYTDQLGSDESKVAFMLPKWLSIWGVFGFDFLVIMLFGNGILLCGTAVYFLFSRRLSDAFASRRDKVERVSDTSGTSEKPVAKRWGFSFVGTMCFVFGLLWVVWPQVSDPPMGVSIVNFYDYAVGTFRVGFVLIAFGVVFLLAARTRFCQVVAGIACFIVGIINVYVLIHHCKSVFGAVSGNGVSSVFAVAWTLYCSLLVLFTLASVFVFVIGILAFRRRGSFAEGEAAERGSSDR